MDVVSVDVAGGITVLGPVGISTAPVASRRGIGGGGRGRGRWRVYSVSLEISMSITVFCPMALSSASKASSPLMFRRLMQHLVDRLREDHQILIPVVPPVLINMVHLLVGHDGSSYFLFSDAPVCVCPFVFAGVPVFGVPIGLGTSD
uniref:Uncharacterized protein n=1 Tax=Arcella intermedia TaxID=1963864 RepID=A0A6B2LMC2_9EUKA